MKRDVSKILVLCLFSILLVSFIAAIVAAADTPINVYVNTGGVSNPLKMGPTSGTWYSDIIISLFGTTWEEIISAFIVFLVIGMGIWDILQGFGLFRSKYVQFIIAFGVAILSAIAGVIIPIAKFFFTLGAGLGAAAVIVGVGVPLLIFIILNILFFKIFLNLRTKKTTAEIKAGADEAAAAAEGLGKIAGGFKKARDAAEK